VRCWETDVHDGNRLPEGEGLLPRVVERRGGGKPHPYKGFGLALALVWPWFGCGEAN